MRRLVRAGLVGAAALLVPAAALAHPLGNFTINHYDGLRISTDAVLVDHVLDMAEIPTFQERQGMDADGDGMISDAEATEYARSRCQALPAELDLEQGGHRLRLDLTETGIAFPQGQGAVTLRLVCEFRAPLAASIGAGTARFTFQDSSYAGRRGWREIVVQGDGTTVGDSDAPAEGVSRRLTSYPPELLATPSDQESAAWSAVPGGPALAPLSIPDAVPVGVAATGARDPVVAVPASTSTASVPGGVADLGSDVMAVFNARDLTPPAVLVAFLVAAGLGALHAVSPGHGKTVMAAYLVGSRGSARQALGLGLTVTVSHTIGVLALGLVSLSFASLLPPDRLYPILGITSGLIVVAIGLWLVAARIRETRARHAAVADNAHDVHEVDLSAHDHGHSLGAAGHVHDGDLLHAHDDGHSLGAADHAHGAADHVHDGDLAHALEPGHAPHLDPAADALAPSADEGWHSHGGRPHTHVPARGATLSWRGLVALGLAGGMVPSVSALIVLLGSISLGRPAFGIFLTVAFGAGMAIVLVGIGMTLVYARGWIERVPTRLGNRRVSHLLPTATAFVVLLAGLLITTQALLTLR